MIMHQDIFNFHKKSIIIILTILLTTSIDYLVDSRCIFYKILDPRNGDNITLDDLLFYIIDNSLKRFQIIIDIVDWIFKQLFKNIFK
jgi:hypothetical protein